MSRTGTLSFFDAARERPGATALVVGGVAHTFGALAPRVRAVCDWLGAAGAVDRVALVANNRIDTVLAIWALLERGEAILLVHPRLTAGERARLLADHPHSLLLDESWRAPEGDGAYATTSAPALERECAVVFSSGTTGKPKGASMPRRAFLASAAGSAANLGWQPGDRWLLCMPLAHVGGLSIVTRCLLARAAVVLGDSASGRFEPLEIIDAIERHRVTLASLVPTMMKRLFDAAPGWKPPAHLRACLLGGAAAPPALLDEAAARGVPALTTYGLTEACSQVTVQRLGSRPSRSQGAGRPLDGVELQIVDGAVRVRGPILMTRYLPVHEFATPIDADGWLATGDLGEIDDEGRLHIHSRRTDLIITGGENVYPVEVEQTVERAPGVAGAIVFGVPDETWGQLVAVAIVARAEAPADADLRAFLERELASHKRPRLVAFIAEIPLGSSGKPDRRAVAATATAQLRKL